MDNPYISLLFRDSTDRSEEDTGTLDCTGALQFSRLCDGFKLNLCLTTTLPQGLSVDETSEFQSCVENLTF